MQKWYLESTAGKLMENTNQMFAMNDTRQAVGTSNEPDINTIEYTIQRPKLFEATIDKASIATSGSKASHNFISSRVHGDKNVLTRNKGERRNRNL